MEPMLIAQDFLRRYEQFWSEGATDVSRVYVADAIRCGYEIVRSAQAIGSFLGVVHRQGWQKIAIEVAEVASIDGAILVACRYTASSAKEEMKAKSSYVLVQSEKTWKAAMHTAT